MFAVLHARVGTPVLGAARGCLRRDNFPLLCGFPKRSTKPAGFGAYRVRSSRASQLSSISCSTLVQAANVSCLMVQSCSSIRITAFPRTAVFLSWLRTLAFLFHNHVLILGLRELNFESKRWCTLLALRTAVARGSAYLPRWLLFQSFADQTYAEGFVLAQECIWRKAPWPK